MDRWAWSHVEAWLAIRTSLAAGRLFCIVRGPTRGRPCTPAGIRQQLHDTALAAGVRRRFAPHQLPPRPCGRDVARGDLANRDPAPTRARRPRSHHEIPARNRQHRDHPSRPPAARTDDLSQSTTPPRALTIGAGCTRLCGAAMRRGPARSPRSRKRKGRRSATRPSQSDCAHRGGPRCASDHPPDAFPADSPNSHDCGRGKGIAPATAPRVIGASPIQSRRVRLLTRGSDRPARGAPSRLRGPGGTA